MDGFSVAKKSEQNQMVMGYHRPTSGFNVGKKQEFADRKYFSEKVSMTHCEDAKDKAAK